MKRIILTTGVLLMTAALVFGQQRQGRSFGTPEENARRSAERRAEELQLSDAQKDSVYAITLAGRKAMEQAFREQREDQRGQLMGKMRELRSERDQKILSILDENQKKAYEKLMEERQHRQRPGEGRRGGRGGERSDRSEG